jgi:MerR family transcriptional regulator/heat shock protein HspR
MPTPRDARALYVISVAAELAGVHPQTLRIYERKGLIEPARTSGRSRRYSDRDIALLQRIQELTNEGVSLVGVQKILDLESLLGDARVRIEQLEAALDDAQREMRDAVEAAHKQYRRDLVPLRQSTVVRFTSGQS